MCASAAAMLVLSAAPPAVERWDRQTDRRTFNYAGSVNKRDKQQHRVMNAEPPVGSVSSFQPETTFAHFSHKTFLVPNIAVTYHKFR